MARTLVPWTQIPKSGGRLTRTLVLSGANLFFGEHVVAGSCSLWPYWQHWIVLLSLPHEPHRDLTLAFAVSFFIVTTLEHQKRINMASVVSSQASAADFTKGQDIELHELAKGWKAAIARAQDPATRYVPSLAPIFHFRPEKPAPFQAQYCNSLEYCSHMIHSFPSSSSFSFSILNRHEARIKNDRGNLPLHSAASFRAPIEVTEALLEAYPEAASITNNYGNLALHFTAWKKGPLDVEKLLLKVYPEGATQKNNHGNLPLHYAAHYNAPLEVVEALYQAFPEGAYQKNNDSNTPLDLAIADGASPNVVALLQGKTVPPSDDEVLESAKSRCDRMEKELQRAMEGHDDVQEDLEAVLSVLMEVKEGHSHGLYSCGMDPSQVTDMDSLLLEVRRAGEEERRGVDADESSLNRVDTVRDEEEDLQMIEESLLPPDDDVSGCSLASLAWIQSRTIFVVFVVPWNWTN